MPLPGYAPSQLSNVFVSLVARTLALDRAIFTARVTGDVIAGNASRKATFAFAFAFAFAKFWLTRAA